MKLMLTLFVTVLLISACGGESTSGGACSSSFISDYNSISSAARTARSRADLENIKQRAQQFKQTYAGAKCSARTARGVEVIDADQKMDQTISVIDTALAATP